MKPIILTEDEATIIYYLIQSYSKDNPNELPAIQPILQGLMDKIKTIQNEED